MKLNVFWNFIYRELNINSCDGKFCLTLNEENAYWVKILLRRFENCSVNNTLTFSYSIVFTFMCGQANILLWTKMNPKSESLRNDFKTFEFELRIWQVWTIKNRIYMTDLFCRSCSWMSSVRLSRIRPDIVRTLVIFTVKTVCSKLETDSAKNISAITDLKWVIF